MKKLFISAFILSLFLVLCSAKDIEKKSLRINKVQDIYGYEISSFWSKDDMKSNIVTTFNCDGSSQTTRYMQLGEHSETNKKNSDKLKITSVYGKMSLVWEYISKEEREFDFLFLSKDKKIFVGKTRYDNMGNNYLTSIKQVKNCK